MTDWQRFKHGGTTFPLTSPATNTLLRDADPFLFYALEYYATVLTTHIGQRVIEEATAGEIGAIKAVVAQVLPLNPEPFLTEEHIQFPLLAAYRKGTTYEHAGQRKIAVDQVDVVYVLPPLSGADAERILPVLKAVAAIIDNRTEQGFDPSYTPTTPTGTAGELVWAAARAGLSKVQVETLQYGGYTPSPDLFFPAVIIGMQVKERSESVETDLQTYDGADVAQDLRAGDGTSITDFVQTATKPPPILVSLNSTTGTKQGGQPLTLTCTGLVVGQQYRALFGGSDASSVKATATTTLTCVTPASAAYPTRAVDVTILDQFGQASNTLVTGYTFTTP